jgi:hypothetical protein
MGDTFPTPGAAAANTAALNAAIERLLSDLRKAKVRFDTSNNAGRDGSVLALRAVAEFIGQLQPVLHERLHLPLVALHDALESLDSNREKPILKATPKPGHPPASQLHQSMKGHAVFTARALCGLGMQTPRAYSLVAKELSKAGVKSRKGKMTGDTIAQWDQDVATDVGRHGTAAQACNSLENEFTARKAILPPEAKARIDTSKLRQSLLEDLRFTVRQLRVHEE